MKRATRHVVPEGEGAEAPGGSEGRIQPSPLGGAEGGVEEFPDALPADEEVWALSLGPAGGSLPASLRSVLKVRDLPEQVRPSRGAKPESRASWSPPRDPSLGLEKGHVVRVQNSVEEAA